MRRWCSPELGGGACGRFSGNHSTSSGTWDSEELGDSWSLESIMERGVFISYGESKSTLRVRVNDFPSPSPPERRRVSPHLKVTCMATQHLLFLEGWVPQQKLGWSRDSGPTRTMPFLGVDQESRQKQMTGQAEHVCWPLCERRALCGINPCSCGQNPTFGPSIPLSSP